MVLVSVAGATTDTIGGTSLFTPLNGYIRCNPITASANGTLQTLGANWETGGNGNMRLALYYDDPPYLLLAQTASTPTANGWVDSNATTAITSGANYYECFQDDSPLDALYYNSGGALLYVAYSYGAYPSSLSGFTGGVGATWNVRMNYTVGITTTSTTTSTTSTTSSTTTSASTTTSISTSTSSTTSTSTTSSTSTSSTVPTTSIYTTTINPRNSTLVNATIACGDLPCVLSYTFAIPEISLIFVFVAFGIAWQVTHKLINGLASALIVAVVMVGIAPTLLNISVLVVIGFFVVLSYYVHAYERKSN